MFPRHLLADARFAVRLLRRTPGFAATLFFLLVGGLGATTAMFSVVESLLLSPLPYDHPEQLTVINTVPMHEPNARFSISLPDFLDWKAQSNSFSEMTALRHQSFTLTAPGAKPERLDGAVVTGEFFDLFRLHPLHGRLLTTADDRKGGPRVAVISAALWHTRFGSDPALVGGTARFDGEDYTVVGIGPEGFSFGGVGAGSVDVWAPIAVTSPEYVQYEQRRGERFLRVMARLKPGVSLATAQVEMSAIADRIATAAPDTNQLLDARVRDLHGELVRKAKSGVLILFAAVGLVFLVVCANVANLLLTRGAARRAEVAIRAALGATRQRLIVQLLTETTVMFLVSALAGLVFARWLLDRLVGILPLGGMARALGVHMDGTAFVACVGTSLIFGLSFGLVPALMSTRVEPEVALKQSAARAGASRTHHLVRGALVVSQVALAFALLVGAGLALRAFTSLNDTDPGFAVEDRVTATISLSPVRYADDAAVRSFVDRLITLVEAQPGVSSAAVNVSLPFSGSNSSSSFEIEGRPPFAAGDSPDINRNVVTHHYFQTMGMHLLRGRDFAPDDVTASRRVMVVTRKMADRFFPNEDPVGHRLDWGDSYDGDKHWVEIVGVVNDVHRFDLSTAPDAEAFELVTQRSGQRDFSLVIHSTRGPELLHELPGLLQQVDTDEAVSHGTTLRELVADSLELQRSLTILLALFAGAALILATLGVFGLVSYSTAQRTRELGIRMALGSTPEAVVALVVRSGLSLLGLGLSLGLVAALLVGRLLASRLADVPAFDLAVYSGVPLLLMATGVLACLVPALRAVRIPPAVALRYE
jgi:putative ABC transport system permease protein